jgi:hypothetical protein
LSASQPGVIDASYDAGGSVSKVSWLSVVEPAGSFGCEPVDDGSGGGAVITGGTFTVRDALPDTPSLSAVMVVVPAAIAVTAPRAETEAATEFELLHATARPVNGLPAESRSVAVACAV